MKNEHMLIMQWIFIFVVLLLALVDKTGFSIQAQHRIEILNVFMSTFAGAATIAIGVKK